MHVPSVSVTWKFPFGLPSHNGRDIRQHLQGPKVSDGTDRLLLLVSHRFRNGRDVVWCAGRRGCERIQVVRSREVTMNTTGRWMNTLIQKQWVDPEKAEAALSCDAGETRERTTMVMWRLESGNAVNCRVVMSLGGDL